MSASAFNLNLTNIYLLGDLYDSFYQNNLGLISAKQGLIGDNTQDILVNATIANQGTVLTIFEYVGGVFTRVNTSAKNEDGTYAVDTILTEQIIINSLISGNVWYGITIFDKKDYYGRYTPIYDSNTNALIGAKGTGVPF